MSGKTLFIAEIGNNHNGDLERAKRLISQAKEIGCDIAKFQIRDFPSLYRGNTNSVEDLGVEYTKDILKKYELKTAQHFELARCCSDIGIEYMCTPWDLKSVDVLEEIGVKRYKVASADFDNLLLIERLKQTGKPLIFSTGMATSAEIETQVSRFEEMALSILYCIVIVHTRLHMQI